MAVVLCQVLLHVHRKGMLMVLFQAHKIYKKLVRVAACAARKNVNGPVLGPLKL